MRLSTCGSMKEYRTKRELISGETFTKRDWFEFESKGTIILCLLETLFWNSFFVKCFYWSSNEIYTDIYRYWWEIIVECIRLMNNTAFLQTVIYKEISVWKRCCVSFPMFEFKWWSLLYVLILVWFDSIFIQCAISFYTI